MLKYALEAKMGFDPTNSHYGTDENKAVINAESMPGIRPAQTATANDSPLANPASISNTEVDQDEGMYL